jgi:hypothetical protein
MQSDTRARSAWAALFGRKNGASPLTRLWEEWDADSQRAALGTVPLEDDGELAVVVSRPGADGQLVLTTRRLIYQSAIIVLDEMTDVAPVGIPSMAKNDLEELDLTVSTGARIRISVERGGPYLALWSVLLNIVRRNSHR